MNRYDISLQTAMPVGQADSLLWFIQFQPIGRVDAYSAEQALRIARALGWGAVAVSPEGASVDVPQLRMAPLRVPRNAPHSHAAPGGKTTTFRQKGRLV
jgi:hypothetical protein